MSTPYSNDTCSNRTGYLMIKYGLVRNSAAPQQPAASFYTRYAALRKCAELNRMLGAGTQQAPWVVVEMY